MNYIRNKLALNDDKTILVDIFTKIAFKNAKILMDRHNRTKLAIGENYHKRIQDSHVFLIGMNPLGTEIAKSLLLFGANNISIYDDELVTYKDMFANLFISKEDINKNRAEVMKKSLKRLNPSATISISNDMAIRTEYNVVIVTKHLSFEQITNINKECRNNNVGFVLSDTYSFAGFAFIDFGDDYIVENATGVPPKRYRIDNISQNNPGRIRFIGKTQPFFARNTKIKFEGLTSMCELNSIGAITMTNDDGIFSICDTSSFSPYDQATQSGFAIEVKEPKHIHFESYESCLEGQFMAHLFLSDHDIVRKFFIEKQKNGETDEFYVGSTTSLIACIATNEAIKCMTRCYIPMKEGFQWYLYNCDQLFNIETKETKTEVFDKVKQSKILIAGVGAIGCEAAKLFALNGVSELSLVDPDNIETTNLNRQILFSDDDIGKNKADVAAQAIRKFNSGIKIETYPQYINEENKSLFSNKWFSQFDAVFAMVDSFQAREYIGRRAARVDVPMFTGGISKITADWETVIPYHTLKYDINMMNESNSSTQSCTLKFFPSTPEHCIEWAHHQFNRVLQIKDVASFADCVKRASQFFSSKFFLRIKDLQHYHPKDQIVNGVLYWSHHRIYPNVIEYDADNIFCTKLIQAMSRIIAINNKISIEEINFDDLVINQNWTPPSDNGNGRIAENDEGPQSTIANGFNHDDELHIDFVEAASNLRSMNYGLGHINRLKVQMLAGKIQTAICTTSAVCSAGLFIEYLMHLIDPTSTSHGKFVVSPLSLMTYRSCSPRTFKLGKTEETFNEWDKYIIDGERKLMDVQAEIEAKANAKLASWASATNGYLLPVLGGFNSKTGVFTPESTFKSIFPDDDEIQIEPFFINDQNNDDLLFPTLIVSLSK